jgi:hypothetical protein
VTLRLRIVLDGLVADSDSDWMKRGWMKRGWTEIHADEFGSDLRTEMVDSRDSRPRLGGLADMRAFRAWASPNTRSVGNIVIVIDQACNRDVDDGRRAPAWSPKRSSPTGSRPVPGWARCSSRTSTRGCDRLDRRQTKHHEL